MLAEITVEDADAQRASAVLFVRCRRDGAVPSTKATTPSASPLLVDVVDAQRVWQARVAAADKPMALDCSPEEYLSTLARALSGVDGVATARFQFRWSRKVRTLTLMEQTASGLAMKYAALTFADHDDAKYLPELLHSIVDEHAGLTRELASREERVRELEALVRDKDVLLEQALDAKQRVEDALVEGFCAVLNAKKDEIQRLQTEVAIADNRANVEKPAVSRKTVAKKRKTAAVTGAKRTRATRGAKIKKQTEEEEGSDDNSSKSNDDNGDSDRDSSDDSVDEDDDEAGRKRARREAIGAYSQLPDTLRTGTQRICSSDDVLSDLDAIMKSEVEANEAEQQHVAKENPTSTATARAREVPPRRSQQMPKGASAQTSKTDKSRRRTVRTKSEVAAVPTKATAAAAGNSVEEDIFDILG